MDCNRRDSVRRNRLHNPHVAPFPQPDDVSKVISPIFCFVLHLPPFLSTHRFQMAQVLQLKANNVDQEVQIYPAHFGGSDGAVAAG